MEHTLRPPSAEAEWDAYHAIRERVLWEARGRVGVYRRDHPDEFEEGSHPLLLLADGTPVGVVRVDVGAGGATLRRVAVHEDAQRRGHGRALLELAENFARKEGCNRALSHVDPDAVGFYAKLGYSRSARQPDVATVLMEKSL